MAQQLVFSDAAYSGDGAQLRTEALVSERALIFYRKAVRFLLNIAYERKRSRVSVYADLTVCTCDERSCSVPVILHHAEHRNAYAKLFQRALGRCGVGNAAVYQQQLPKSRCRRF